MKAKASTENGSPPKALFAFSERFRGLFEKQGESINSFARRCGISVALAFKYLKQETGNPSLEVLVTIAKRLNTTVSYLIGESDIGTGVSDFVRVIRWKLSSNGDKLSSEGSCLYHQ